MDIGRSLKAGWELFLKDIVILIVGGIVVTLLTAVTVGILGGPLFAGYCKMIIRRARENRPAEFGDVFGCFDSRFLSYLVAFYLMIIGAIPLLYFASLWIYVFPLMVERGLDLGDALRTSTDMVKRNNTGMHWGLMIILAVINAVLGKLTPFGFAGILSVPFSFCCIVAAYISLNPIHGQVQQIIQQQPQA